LNSENDDNESMPLKRRSRLETCCDILKVVGSGADKPTHIMYKANLSWLATQDYVKMLEAQGLLALFSDEEGRRSYHLTSRGLELLRQYKSIEENLPLKKWKFAAHFREREGK
jgi:predicted transcriptional regulator